MRNLHVNKVVIIRKDKYSETNNEKVINIEYFYFDRENLGIAVLTNTLF